MKHFALGFAVIAFLGMPFSSARADFEIGVIEGTGKTREEASLDAYRRAVVKGLQQEYGIEIGPLSDRITKRPLRELMALFDGTGNGTTAQRSGSVAVSFMFHGEETRFDDEIRRTVDEALKASGAPHILTAFAVTSSKQVILDAESDWLKGRNEYSPQAALQRANDRLAKVGDEATILLEASMRHFGVKFRSTPPGFRQLLIEANSDIGNRQAGAEREKLRTKLLEEMTRPGSQFSRAAIGVIDIDRRDVRNGQNFTYATVSGNLLELPMNSDGTVAKDLVMTPFHLNVRGHGRDLDAAVKSVLDAASRDIVLRQLTAAILRNTSEKKSYTVHLCDIERAKDLLFVENTLSDFGQVSNHDNKTMSVAEPMLSGASPRPFKSVAEFAAHIEDRFESRKWPVRLAAGTGVIDVGRCKK